MDTSLQQAARTLPLARSSTASLPLNARAAAMSALAHGEIAPVNQVVAPSDIIEPDTVLAADVELAKTHHISLGPKM